MSRVRLDINLEILRRNFNHIARHVAPCSVMAVLKANAYGLGGRRVAEALVSAGAARIGVAEINEGLALQDLNVPTQILGAVLPDEIPPAVDAGLTLPITDLATAQLISRAAVAAGKTVKVHFKIDTGMGRLGIPVAQALKVIRSCMPLGGLDFEGIYSHFPMAYRGEAPYTQNQLKAFLSLLNELRALGITFAIRHMANSDAVNNVGASFSEPFNEVRTGINLYGAFDTLGQQILEIDSVLTLSTSLASVRMLPAGMSIGYGCTYTLSKETCVGTIPAGYADGLPLALSNNGHVLVRGQACPVLGRVSMDYTTIDLSGVPDARVGETVVCLGAMGDQAIRVEDWARIKGTHSYDIICSIGTRVERCYTHTERHTP